MAVHKITSLTFEHGPLFTRAKDQAGFTYNVLYACGTPGSAFYLQPWVAEGEPTWRGRSINEGHLLYPAVRAAEDERKRIEAARPIPPAAYMRFASETI
jgi:hypothetical protein